jgi:hypothetical protein
VAKLRRRCILSGTKPPAELVVEIAASCGERLDWTKVCPLGLTLLRPEILLAPVRRRVARKNLVAQPHEEKARKLVDSRPETVPERWETWPVEKSPA